jgi:hypothetical protein
VDKGGTFATHPHIVAQMVANDSGKYGDGNIE